MFTRTPTERCPDRKIQAHIQDAHAYMHRGHTQKVHFIQAHTNRFYQEKAALLPPRPLPGHHKIRIARYGTQPPNADTRIRMSPCFPNLLRNKIAGPHSVQLNCRVKQTKRENTHILLLPSEPSPRRRQALHSLCLFSIYVHISSRSDKRTKTQACSCCSELKIKMS